MWWVLVGLAALVAVAAAVYFALGGAAGFLEIALPEFPELPPPTAHLDDERSGPIYFATHTPTDLDVLLADSAGGLATTGVGTLFVPEAASAASPVPAMVVLHGSGGISPGREMEYGKLLADNGIAAFVVDYYSPRGVLLTEFVRDDSASLRSSALNCCHRFSVESKYLTSNSSSPW